MFEYKHTYRKEKKICIYDLNFYKNVFFYYPFFVVWIAWFYDIFIWTNLSCFILFWTSAWQRIWIVNTNIKINHHSIQPHIYICCLCVVNIYYMAIEMNDGLCYMKAQRKWKKAFLYTYIYCIYWNMCVRLIGNGSLRAAFDSLHIFGVCFVQSRVQSMKALSLYTQRHCVVHSIKSIKCFRAYINRCLKWKGFYRWIYSKYSLPF